MPDTKLDLLGPTLAAVGREVMNIVGGEPSGIFLYAEVGDGWVEPSLFKDEGQDLRYVDIGTSRIDLLITDVWCLEPDSKRWTAIRYSLEHGEFITQFD